MGFERIGRYYLIYDQPYPNKGTPLNYLQCLQVAGKCTDNRREALFKICQENVEKYNKYKRIAAMKLLSDFKVNFPNPFAPDAYIAPPTNDRSLQKPYTEIFKQEFPQMEDLSRFFKKDELDRGAIKMINEAMQIVDTLDKREKILIIDDVYATGKTVATTVSSLEKISPKSGRIFIVICPLWIK